MGKHYAIADIHGMYNIYEQVCEILEPGDVVYFLGDAGDRGPDGFKCIEAIYNNPQWIYLKGNHEDLMVNALREKYQSDDPYAYKEYQLWRWNGGHNTELGWKENGEDLSWIEKLDNLPTYVTYINPDGVIFHLTHAGYTCGKPIDDDSLLWDRNHFYDKWNEKKYPYDICIHGHTPLFYLRQQLDDYEGHVEGVPEAKVYCNGHKICIDNGVFMTKSTVLYDLDEMTVIPLFDNSNWEF